jgi:glycine hydroxymethyltransferase
MFMVDLSRKGVTGIDAQKLLDTVGITVNKNSIPHDKEKPFITSGIRIGTPAITTRGMKEKETALIAELIDTTLKNPGNETVLEEVRKKVGKLIAQFPLYA